MLPRTKPEEPWTSLSASELIKEKTKSCSSPKRAEPWQLPGAAGACRGGRRGLCFEADSDLKSAARGKESN